MATVDTSIYQNFLRPPKSIQEYQAENDQRAANQLALQQGHMNLLAAQRSQADEEAVRQAYQQPDFNPQSDEGIKRLLAINPKAGYAALQARQAAEKSAADVGHVKAQTTKEEALSQKAQIEATGSRLKQYRDTLDFVDTPQGAARWLKAQFDDPLTAPQMGSMGSFEQAVTRIPQDPQGFQQWRSMAALGMEKHLEQLRAAAADAEKARHNKADEGITIRGQNLTDSRARDLNDITKAAQRAQVVETPEGVMIVDKGTGLARPAATMNGKLLPGKPSESVKKELVNIGQQRSIVQGAIDAAEKTPDAFTFRRGLATMTGPLSESLVGRLDTDTQRQARAYVFNNVSKVINERAGAAQSAQELARLRGFLPAETDNADQIVSKLKAFQTYLSDLEAGTKGKPAEPKVVDFGSLR